MNKNMKGQRKKKEYERPSENTGHDFDLPVKKKKAALEIRNLVIPFSG